MSLKGKVAIITGGSRGIGFETAKVFLENGATVVITSKNKQQLENASNLLINAFAVSADITKEEEVRSVVEKTVEKFGKLDILVNNAGILPKIKQLHEISDLEWNEVLNVNLNGQFRFTKFSIPYLQKTSGTIVNVSSDAGLKAYEGFNADAYSASKAALIVLTKCWSLEYAKDRIRVNCVCPGVVDTDMTKPFLKTEDIAKSILFLASEDSSWTTGAILAVDGGQSTK
ncbi:MAG: SDR family NAD(P)-dependent oxidoreductase [Nitrosopumilaceae archaeon]